MNTDLRKRLCDGAAQLSIPLTEEQTDALLDYLALLVKWNNAYNLTAIRDPEKMVMLHLLDSLTVLPVVDELINGETAPSLLDVGTGAGLPGMVLAIMRPQLTIHLLDSNGKKTRFLFQVKTSLQLDNVSVHHSRVESFDDGDGFSLISSRAFASLQEMVEQSRHLLADNGRFIAMKGIYPEDELKDLPQWCKVEACHTLGIPGDVSERHLVVLSTQA